MMDGFTYHMPTKVVFGSGSLKKLADVLRGKQVLLVCGKSSAKKSGILEDTLEILADHDVEVFEGVGSDPDFDAVDEIAQTLGGKDHIVGLGGGSVLDAAKAASLAFANKASARDMVEGKKTPEKCVDIICVPTTSGTASEITKVSVLTDPASGLKRSFRSTHMYPRVAVADPLLTVTMPADVTISSGLDALTHAVEATTSKKNQPVTNALCTESVSLILKWLAVAADDPEDLDARKNMMLASLLAGFGITNAGAGLCHGLSYGIYSVKGLAHGLACGIVLPHVMRYNMEKHESLYDDMSTKIGYPGGVEFVEEIEALYGILGVPKNLGDAGIRYCDVDKVAENSMSGSTRLNFRETSVGDIKELVESLI